MVDVNAIGAGGGSIAWLDAARAGCASGRNRPAPSRARRATAAAARGDGHRRVGGARLSRPGLFRRRHACASTPSLRARRSTRTVARPLGMSLERGGARHPSRASTRRWPKASGCVSIRRGVDPRRLTLVPLGGAGPLHATALAEELGIGRIVVPRYPGVLSAAGLLVAPVEHEVSAALPSPLADVDVGRACVARSPQLDRRCARADGGGGSRAPTTADPVLRRRLLRRPVAITSKSPLDAATRRPARRGSIGDFLARARPASTVTARDAAGAHRQPARRARIEAGWRDRRGAAYVPNGRRRCKGTRRDRARRRTMLDRAAIYDRAGAGRRACDCGPAIVEQADTTTLVEPGWRGRVARRRHADPRARGGIRR